MSSLRTQPSAVVLVVEDESFVRMTAADMLDDAGFTVIEAGNPDHGRFVPKPYLISQVLDAFEQAGSRP